jgi:hypothetical protein
MPKSKIDHPILSSGNIDLIKDYTEKGKLTPQEYVNLLSGDYDSNLPRSLRFDSQWREFIKNHKLNNESLNSEVLKNLFDKLQQAPNYDADFLDRKSALSNLIENHTLPKEDINHIIENLDNYQLKDFEDEILRQPNVDKAHLSKMIDKSDSHALGDSFFSHPLIDKQMVKQYLNRPNPRVSSRQLADLVSNPKQLIDDSLLERLAFSDKTTGKQVESILRSIKGEKPKIDENEPHAEMAAFNAQQESAQKKREKIIDNLLGITGGQISRGKDYDDPSEEGDESLNWNNWHEGPMYDHRKADALASSDLLTPHQIDHIKRHGSDRQKLNLFYNSSIDPKHAEEMYNHYTDEDGYKKGYHLEDLTDHIEKQNSLNDNYEHYYEKARPEAEEEYPFEQYLKDNDLGDEEKVGQSKDDFIDDYLYNNYDWEHQDPQMSLLDEPKVEDYTYEKHLHPDYDRRLEEAEKAWDDEVKNGDIPDSWYENYDEAIQDIIQDKMRDLHQEDMRNSHENPDFLPAHMPSLQEIKKNKLIKDLNEDRIKVKDAENKIKYRLNNFVPKRQDHTEYGDLQYHTNLAKEYADANKGSINESFLHKKYPNLKDVWKKIFGDKGKLSSEELQQKIDNIPKQKFNVSHRFWDHDSPQNLNNEEQVVFRLDHTPESLSSILSDKETADVFSRIHEAAQRSGHPTNSNTIGWARVDTSNPKHWIIDEVQSDFSRPTADFLEKNGHGNKAEQVEKIMKAHANWREALMNHVIKTAKDNGVELISTHSPESKSKHTGAGKVHSVYKDSYQKVPRAMGFVPVDGLTLPLSQEGEKVFREIRVKNPDLFKGNIIDDLETGAIKAAREFDAHNKASQAKDLEPDMAKKHSDVANFLKDKYNTYQKRIVDLDPSHSMNLVNSVEDFSKQMIHENRLTKEVMQGMKNGVDFIDAYSQSHSFTDADKALKKEPEVPKNLLAHTLDLKPKVVKSEEYELDLLKVEKIDKSVKEKIATTMHLLQQNQDILNQVKESNPQAYQAIYGLIQIMVKAAKETANIDPHVSMHEKQIKDELQSQQEQMQQPGEPQEAPPESSGPGRLPTKDQPIHGRKQVYAPGSIRRYTSQDARIKEESGDWKSFGQGLQPASEGQSGEQ